MAADISSLPNTFPVTGIFDLPASNSVVECLEAIAIFARSFTKSPVSSFNLQPFPRHSNQLFNVLIGKDYCLNMNSELGAVLNSLPGPVLVTGHTGFKGTWLTLLLEELGIDVIGYSLPPEKNSLYSRLKLDDHIPETYGDILNYSTLEKFFTEHQPSVVFHLAAQPLVLKSYQAPLKTFNVNVIGTANVLNISLATNSVRAIGAVTTDKVYKNDNLGRRFYETDPLEGKDPYSASKVGSEAVISAYQNISKIENGPKIMALRAGNVIGGGDYAEDRLIPDLIRALEKKQRAQIRNPDSTRPWQHVLDPLMGYVLAVESALLGNCERAFNFGPTEESIKVAEILRIFRKTIGQDVDIAVGSDTQNLEAIFLGLQSSLALGKLEWAPKFTQLEAIEKTFAWWEAVLGKKLTPLEAVKQDLVNFLKK